MAGEPFRSSIMRVEPQWVDYNGHLNMAYYHVLFDRCADQVFDLLDIGKAYAAERRLTIYTAETHVCYVRELHEGDAVTCRFQILDHDEKRIHGYQELVHVDGWLAATCEALSLHVDMAGPRVAPFPGDILATIERMAGDHAALARPERAGRSVGIRRNRP